MQTGNLEDDFAALAGCDLVIEAVVERLDVKRALFERLEKTLGADAVVASNTSGLRIQDMLEGRGAGFKQHFLVMHFFNPVRYMKLLELVAGPETSAEVKGRVEHFGRETLGKGIVWAKDTPNFVGNRIGTHAMLWGIQQMLADRLAPEDLDAITGEPMAHPEERELPYRGPGWSRYRRARRGQLLPGAGQRSRARRVPTARVHPRDGEVGPAR